MPIKVYGAEVAFQRVRLSAGLILEGTIKGNRPVPKRIMVNAMVAPLSQKERVPRPNLSVERESIAKR